MPIGDQPRPPRADARRNRQRVLTAARAAFAEDGLAVPIDEIARRAGVGAGTVYRHFPTKAALVAAIVRGRLEDLVAHARALAAAEHPAPGGEHPGSALFGLLARMLDEGDASRDLKEALGQPSIPSVDPQLGLDLRAAVGSLLERAQRAGQVRPDVAVADVMSLVAGAFAALSHRGGGVQVRTHLRDVFLDGLRPAGPPAP